MKARRGKCQADGADEKEQRDPALQKELSQIHGPERVRKLGEGQRQEVGRQSIP